MLEATDRIEAVRRPGTTLWGANAVNGVINIITRSEKETQATLLSGGRLEGRGFGTVRYGGKLGTHTSYRFSSRFGEAYGSEMVLTRQPVVG